MALKIAISAGELSGDEHASKLVAALRQLRPDVELRGMGGRFSRSAGVETIVDSERSASAMGFQELITQLPKILGAMSKMKGLLRDWHPDILVLVDFPDFNLRLARYAKSLGIKVFYFIIPKLWAWRTGRVEHFKRYVDHAALIFPFEKDFLEKLGYSKCSYVGHPFATDFKPTTRTRDEVFKELGLNPDFPTIAVLPGSRKSETKRHLSRVAGAFKILKERVPNIQGIVVIAPSLENSKAEFLPLTTTGLKLTTLKSLEIMSVCDVGLIKSGTSNLQAAYCRLPFVMFFVASALGAWIVRIFVKISHYSIVNIIQPGTLTELVQEDASPIRLADELFRLLSSEETRVKMLADFEKLRANLYTSDVSMADAYTRTANTMLSMFDLS